MATLPNNLQDARSQQAQVQDMSTGGPAPQQLLEQGVMALAQEMGPQQAGQMLMQMGQNLMNSAPQQGAQPTATPQAGPRRT